MKVRDPLQSWEQPEMVSKWGEEISPSPKNAWIDYINYYVQPDIVTIVSRLLIPAFVEHDGGVFLSSKFTLQNYSAWKEKISDVSQIERIINHQHIYDIFGSSIESKEESFRHVAFLMAQTHRLSLHDSFPNRNFNVYVTDNDQDYGPIVTFYSI